MTGVVCLGSQKSGYKYEVVIFRVVVWQGSTKGPTVANSKIKGGWGYRYVP